ncbi:protocatechuate 3,4-dioxygenase [soil metagenome]
MSRSSFPSNRRRFLGSSLALGALAFTSRGAFADELMRTPSQTEGPFYPTQLPLDTDNDLLIINDSITPAIGEVTHLGGRILDAKGNPVRNALVEIWQVDHNGAYLHTGTANRDKADANFQGFGRFLTGSSGEYYFRTVKPVPYPGRTPHIHFKILKGSDELLTTQCYVKGHPGNPRDGIFNRLDPKAQEAVSVDFTPMENSRIGELAARFDVVLGFTPEG